MNEEQKSLYEELQQMPVVTVEQIVRFREAALDAILEAYKQGWIEAAIWAQEEYLKEDVSSLPYVLARQERIGK